jgi:hypothetical protein
MDEDYFRSKVLDLGLADLFDLENLPDDDTLDEEYPHDDYQEFRETEMLRANY